MTGQWFSPGTLVSSINKTEIVLKVALNTINHNLFIITGILDQGAGVLIVFDETPVDKTYANSLDTIQNMGKVVDALYNKAKKLS